MVIATVSKVLEQLLHFRGIVLVQLAFEKMFFFPRHAPKEGQGDALVLLVHLCRKLTVGHYGAGEEAPLVLVFVQDVDGEVFFDLHMPQAHVGVVVARDH